MSTAMLMLIKTWLSYNVFLLTGELEPLIVLCHCNTEFDSTKATEHILCFTQVFSDASHFPALVEENNHHFRRGI